MAIMKSIFNKIFFAGTLLLLVVSCSNEEEPQFPDLDAGREKSVVDIAISLSEGWDIDDDATRATPPTNTENYNEDSYDDIEKVDKVRVVTFRRKEGDEGEFYYDMQNDQILTVEKGSGESENKEHAQHQHRFAKGKLTKTYGYEYRVIAIAYSSNRGSASLTTIVSTGEDKWMKIFSDTYSNFYAKLVTWDCSEWNEYLDNKNLNHINKEILDTPQIFYGTLHSQICESDIIPYAEEDVDGEISSNIDLTGILKRGVAKIKVVFKGNKNVSSLDSNYGIQWISVLAETPNTKVKLQSYDDFLRPSEPLDKKYKPFLSAEINQYTVVGRVVVGGGLGEAKDNDVVFWLLPCKTRLAIRVKSIKEEWLSSTVNIRNGQLIGSDVELHGNNGTGIVSPDFIDGVFYFRRNHKYVITVKSSESVVTGHPLN